MTLDPDQQETLYQTNQIRVMLDYAGSWSAGTLYQKNQIRLMTLDPDLLDTFYQKQNRSG